MSTTHRHCCKNLKPPTTPNDLAGLPYPSNQKRDSGSQNRLHNVDPGFVKSKNYGGAQGSTNASRHKGWWFKIDPKATPLLDGSSDGKIRGFVQHAAQLNGVNAVCLNAASLKLLDWPKGLPLPEATLKRAKKAGTKAPTKVLCGFSWANTCNDPTNTHRSANPSSGWIPLDCIIASEKSRKKMTDDLEGWSCCIEQYAKWGIQHAGKKAVPHVFLSAEEVHHRLLGIAGGGSLTAWFDEHSKGSVRSILVDWKRFGPKLKIGGKWAFPEHGLIGVVKACSKGNMITDYAARTPDKKDGAGGPDGYVNLCPNAVDTAPIPIDVFPAGWTFHVLQFKKPPQKRVLSKIYKPPQIAKAQLRAHGHAAQAKKVNATNGTVIGHAAWYFGYCETEDGERRQRRYGWVPALALKKPGEDIPRVADPFA